MTAALTAIGEGESIRHTSSRFGIPRSTLQDCLKSGNTLAALLRQKPVLSRNAEKELVAEIIQRTGKKENKKQEQQTRIKVRNYQKARLVKRVLVEDGLTQNVICNDSKMAKTVSRETGDVSSSDEESEAEVNKEVCLVCDKFGKNEIWLTRHAQMRSRKIMFVTIVNEEAISAPSNCG
ncbi:hypothetical protein ILUMI_18980 [Ignelater luminosus]|uniref:HTH psq-type domain-containing protein n=1 Tax=Ignelater luminosus TaxID=2038154 RepID=A0A8K0CIY3_IGNLU|nr:hypothetical protein ILUMI_18980 [Ignelater luminosus]